MRRSRHGVAPTEAGRLLYPEARRALEALTSAERTLTDHHGEIAVRIAASHTVGEFLLPGWLGQLRAEFPGLCPQVDVVNSPTVLSRLRAFEIDVGFVEGEDSLDGLESVTLVEDEIVAVVGREHPWARLPCLNAEDLKGQTLIARERGSATRAVAESRLQDSGVDLAPGLQLSSIESVKRALPGGGYALISRVAVEEEVKSGALVALRVCDADLKRSLLAVRRPDPLPGAGSQLIWESIAKVAQGG